MNNAQIPLDNSTLSVGRFYTRLLVFFVPYLIYSILVYGFLYWSVPNGELVPVLWAMYVTFWTCFSVFEMITVLSVLTAKTDRSALSVLRGYWCEEEENLHDKFP